MYFARFFSIRLGMKKTSPRNAGCSPKNFFKKSYSARRPVPFGEPIPDQFGFAELFLRRISWEKLQGLSARRHPTGRPTYILSRSQLLLSLLFHYSITLAGSFAEHVLLLTGIAMSEGTLSERRQALPFSVFTELLRLVLRPLEQVPQSGFYKEWLLVAIDAVEFNVRNTTSINQDLEKSYNQHSEPAAFAKLRCAVLVELTAHNPLGAQLGLQGESEWHLAQGLLEHLPNRSLLLGDRLYGCGAFVIAAHKMLQPGQGHLLVRAKIGATVKRVIKVLKDGSRLVEIKALEPKDKHRIAETMIVRDIRATLQRKGSRPIHVRYWTTLLDAQEHPAEELVALYASRWEHELYFRELKCELGVNKTLQSQTVETAAQEVAAMIIGSALIAEERSKLKPGEPLAHRISFIKTREILEPLWLTLTLCGDILTQTQKEQMAGRFYWMASKLKSAKKRARSCPRAIRQPRKRWPRKRNQQSFHGPLAISITATPP